MRIAILGSCVTRDMVQFLPANFQLALYVARTSFVSLASDAVLINEEDIAVEHDFNKRVVFWDMTKAFWQKLEEAKPDIIIIDLIDERFDLWRMGGKVVTRSNYLSMSNVEQEYLSGFELLRRSSQSTHDVWKMSCDTVIPRLRSACKKIVLHRSLWAEKYYVDENVVPFDEPDRQLAAAANRWLSDYYDHFMTLCPDAQQIAVPSELCVSNFAHKWGRDFFHYGNAYYKKLAELFSAL